MARIPPGSPCGLRLERDNPLNVFRKRFSRIGPDRTARSDGSARNQGKTPSQGQGRVFPHRRLLLNRIPQSLVASSRYSWFSFLSTIVLTYGPIDFPVKRCLPLARDSVHAQVLHPRCLTEYFTQNLMDLACFCSKSQHKTTTNPQFCNFYKIASKNRRHSNRRPNPPSST